MGFIIWVNGDEISIVELLLFVKVVDTLASLADVLLAHHTIFPPQQQAFTADVRLGEKIV